MLTILTTQQRNNYWKHGYTIIPNLLNKNEIAQLQNECDRLIHQPDLFVQPIPEASVRRDLDGNPVRDRLDPITPLSPMIQNITEHPRLQAALTEIFEDKPTLFKDKLIFKPPRTKGYALHQDYAYWEHIGIAADGVLSVQIAIDAADAENGAIVLYPGLHQTRLPAPKGALRDVCPSAVQNVRTEVISTQPGDVLIFHSLTPHYSEPNRSHRPRRTLYLSYNASQHGDFYRSYYGDRLANASKTTASTA